MISLSKQMKRYEIKFSVGIEYNLKILLLNSNLAECFFFFKLNEPEMNIYNLMIKILINYTE